MYMHGWHSQPHPVSVLAQSVARRAHTAPKDHPKVPGSRPGDANMFLASPGHVGLLSFALRLPPLSTNESLRLLLSWTCSLLSSDVAQPRRATLARTAPRPGQTPHERSSLARARPRSPLSLASNLLSHSRRLSRRSREAGPHGRATDERKCELQ